MVETHSIGKMVALYLEHEAPILLIKRTPKIYQLRIMHILMCPQLKQGCSTKLKRHKVIVKYGLNICGDTKNNSKHDVLG